jgi:import inner membrane translocase subunit TIM17
MSTDGRQPCPDRIVDDIGGAFTIGAVGGTVWHCIKGARNAPKGARFFGSLEAVKNRAPVLGGQCTCARLHLS